LVTNPSKPLRNAVNKIFGEEIPQTSTDERDDDSPAGNATHEDWLRNNVPPHHE
jgi:hypothetical protein